MKGAEKLTFMENALCGIICNNMGLSPVLAL